MYCSYTKLGLACKCNNVFTFMLNYFYINWQWYFNHILIHIIAFNNFCSGVLWSKKCVISERSTCSNTLQLLSILLHLQINSSFCNHHNVKANTINVPVRAKNMFRICPIKCSWKDQKNSPYSQAFLPCKLMAISRLLVQKY